MLKELLLPGVIFIECKTRNPLDKKDMLHLNMNIELLNPETEEFLVELGGTEHHVLMSRGIIQNGMTVVTEGPLKGKEACIRKIDRHKRLARLEVPLSYPLCRHEEVWIGLEIISKS